MPCPFYQTPCVFWGWKAPFQVAFQETSLVEVQHTYAFVWNYLERLMVDGVRIRGQALVVLFVRGFKVCYLPSPMALAMAVMSAIVPLFESRYDVTDCSF